MSCEGAIPTRKGSAGVTVRFDHDGTRVHSTAAAAYRYNNAAWHEVDARELRFACTDQGGLRITGSCIVILNGDR